MSQKSRPASFRPAVESLEDRALMTCAVSLNSLGLLSITGDAAANHIKITGNGNDVVTYDLAHDLQPGVARTVSIALGDGNDVFVGSLHNPRTGKASNLLAGSELLLGVTGGHGIDHMTFDASGVNMDQGTMKIAFYGGDYRNIMDMTYSGINDGGVSFVAYGGAGNDSIGVSMHADPASVAPAPGGFRGYIYGEDGNDTIVFLEKAPATVSDYQTGIDGGAGVDDVVTNIPASHIANAEGIMLV